MKAQKLMFALPLLFVLTLVPAMADSSNIQSMAGILMHFNHFPSKSDKTTLGEIVSDAGATAAEKVLAQALMDVKHKVATSDAAGLQELLANPAASENERTLANILLSLAHHPSDSDKEKLQAMLE